MGTIDRTGRLPHDMMYHYCQESAIMRLTKWCFFFALTAHDRMYHDCQENANMIVPTSPNILGCRDQFLPQRNIAGRAHNIVRADRRSAGAVASCCLCHQQLPRLTPRTGRFQTTCASYNKIMQNCRESDGFPTRPGGASDCFLGKIRSAGPPWGPARTPCRGSPVSAASTHLAAHRGPVAPGRHVQNTRNHANRRGVMRFSNTTWRCF